MKRRFTEEQIVRILQEAEIVGNVREVCRQHNITAQTYYRWRNKFERIGVGYMKRVRALEQENAALKRLVGELSLDNRMLRDVREKK
jgi:putative transposase